MFLFELCQNLLRAFQHFARHARQSGDVDAVTFVGRAVDDLVQEDNVVLPLAHGDV